MAWRVKTAESEVSEIDVLVDRPPLFGGVSAFGDGPGQLDQSGGSRR